MRTAPGGTYVGGLQLFGVQLFASVVTIAFTAVGSLVLLYVTDRLVGLRVTPEEERQGLDESLHGESLG